MGRMYTAQFSAVAITVAQDLFEVLAGSGKPIAVHGWEIFQTSDVGDASEEILRIETVRGVGSVTSGSGGSTPTVQQINDTDTATSATVEANNTTRMATGSGSLETLTQHGWNVRAPIVMIYTPETRPIIRSGDRWTLSLPAAPADSLTTSGTVIFEELAG